MSERMDVVTFKKNDKTGKVFAVRLGSATKSTRGDGWNLYLDAIPAPQEGQYRMSVVPQRERSDAPKRDEMDQDVPF